MKNKVREWNSNTDYIMIVIKTDSRSFGIQTEWTIQKDTQLYSPLLYNKGTHTVQWARMVVSMCGPGGKGGDLHPLPQYHIQNFIPDRPYT